MHQDFRALGRKKQGAGDFEQDSMEQTIPGNCKLSHPSLDELPPRNRIVRVQAIAQF
jgi:hypothetical protein